MSEVMFQENLQAIEILTFFIFFQGLNQLNKPVFDNIFKVLKYEFKKLKCESWVCFI